MQNDKREEVQHDALQEIIQHHRCSIGVSMRVGKTKIALDRLNILYKLNNGNLRVLISAPKKKIFETWVNEAEKFNLEHLIPCFTYTTNRSIHKQELNYDILIIDEVHSILESALPWLNNFSGIILGLTGTPPKHASSTRARIIQRFCPFVFEYLTEEAVDDRILNDYRILVHLLPISDKKNIPVRKRDGGVFYTSELKNYEYWSERVYEADSMKAKQIASVMRMKAMQDFPSKVEYARLLLQQIDEKCLVFANTQNQADRLCSHSFHSKNKKSDENLELFKKGLINHMSCVNQLSEGITIDDLSTTIIMHSFSNERSLPQRLSRTLSLGPDEIATIHILAYKDTCDANNWVPSALETFDASKIKYVEFNI